MLTWTELPDKFGTTMTSHHGTWPELVERIRTVGTFTSKDKCPLVKLATFGTTSSIKGSLRTNANLKSIYGIEADYDGEQVTMAQAAALLESYGIKAALYPSPSNTAQKPRWRVICPLAMQHTPSERAGLVARLNGALNGILANESFTLSQSYFFGATPTNDYQVLVTFDDPDDGSCIDDLNELDEISIGKMAELAQPCASTAIAASAYADHAVVRDLRSALTALRADDRVLWVAVGHALKTLGDQGRSLWLEWSQTSDKYDAQDSSTKWDGFDPSSTGYQSVFSKAQKAGWVNPASAPKSAPIDIANILPKPVKAERTDPDTGQITSTEASHTVPLLGEQVEDDTGRMRLVSVADVLSNPQPPHPFMWGPYLPAEALTLLSGHGGTGKSGFVLQLSAHVAMGLDFLGFPVLREKTLFFSAEDAASILRLRLADICRNHDIDPVELADNLHVMDATDAAVLWRSDGKNKPGEPTDNYAALRQYIHDHNIGFLAVDNASDTFGADRFDKSQVTQFVRALVRLVRERGGSALLLSHVNRTTAAPKGGSKSAGGESYADSVAWHNAARSRLFLAGDDSGDALTLEHEKSNYGKKEPMLNLRRLEGCGMEVVQTAGAGNPAQGYLDDMKLTPILTMMDEFYKRGEWIQPVVTAHTNAFKMLSGEADYPKGLKKTDLFKLLRDAERRNLIHKEVYTNTSRKQTERWKVGFAASAASEPLSDRSAESAGGRASAPSCVGGMGEFARTHGRAEEGAPTTEPTTASIEEGALSSKKRRPTLHLKHTGKSMAGQAIGVSAS